MNRKFTAIFIIVMLASGSLYAGTNNKVAVLYNRGTQVNRNVLHFMGNAFSSLASQYRFYAVGNPSNIKPGMFKAIIVLNTGIRNGVDPKLSAFIDSWKNKSEIILISLYRGSKDLKVVTVPSSINSQGVVAVSAASLWERGGLTSFFGKNTDPRQMHLEWARQVITLLNKKS